MSNYFGYVRWSPCADPDFAISFAPEYWRLMATLTATHIEVTDWGHSIMSEEQYERQSRPRFVIVRPAFRNCLLAFAVLVSALSYFPLNHGSPHTHVLTESLNDDLPVVPLFAIPYIVFLPIFWIAVVYAFVKGRDFAVFALSIAFVYFVSSLVYALYPTYVPRPQHVTGFLSELVRYVYAHDHPYNDFPSEHASSAVLLAFYLWPRGRLLRGAGLILAGLVIPATMLIKQHSVAGAAGGVILATATWFALAYARHHFAKPTNSSQ
jgi:PAP2 superfamily